jgi:hypothetical protein
MSSNILRIITLKSAITNCFDRVKVLGYILFMRDKFNKINIDVTLSHVRATTVDVGN